MTVLTENAVTIDRYPTRSASLPALLPREEPTVWGTADGGPIDATALEGFDNTGFLPVEQLIDSAGIKAYTAEMDRLASDPRFIADSRTVVERDSQEVRAIFEVHRISELFSDLANDPRLVNRARQILGSDVYIHQSRLNHKPAFKGEEFYWHSNFETWHAEDGMPRMRAVSVSIALTANEVFNGSLMVMPGSHRTFVSCTGDTPIDLDKESLVSQVIGTPDPDSLRTLADRHGIHLFTGPAGSATMFDANCMHGSNGNITPYPQSNVFIVYNSVENTLVEPYAAATPRPDFIAARDFTPVTC
ncbi:MAG: ectoine hydroxylase [Micromonosporaceae bacterium]